MRFLLSSIALSLAITCNSQTISLAGEWRFAIDRNNNGVTEKWFSKQLPETIELPGSMAERGKGDDISLTTQWTGSIYDSSFFFRASLAKYRTKENLKIPFWLTPAKHYVGMAWYQKEIVIPAAWQGKRIKLLLERTHIKTRVWLDGVEKGNNNSLSVAHEYDLGELSVGKHNITIAIDNSIKEMNVGPDSHSVSDHTQGNWNGIVGKILLKAVSPVHITNVAIFPDIKNREARVELSVLNAGTAVAYGNINIQAKSFNASKMHETTLIHEQKTFKTGDTTLFTLTLPMGRDMVLWSEFDPGLYELTAFIAAGNDKDTMKRQFGMREFKIQGTQFTINGRPIYLRGTLNNCEFPLTGYPSMSVSAWRRIFRIAKDHGLNHMRFHSWCPPEEAFIAADLAGFYLQPEAPTWPNHGTSVGDGKFIDQYIYEETGRIIKAYGNYASFCMLAAGNEPAGKNQAKYLANFVNYWKAKDNRRVYTGASVGMSWPLVPENEYMVKSGARGLKWNETEPETISDYSAAIKDFNVPYVTHEMGQWCVFPNFAEIGKYTGTYRARNMELFQQDLADHGMQAQARDFLLASGKLQAICYKAEIEKLLRTKGSAGFQLLSLQDFPGQGTALIGVLDAFWDSKPYINFRQFSRFCNTTVPLARINKFVFTNTETLEAELELFHFGEKKLENTLVIWTIKDAKGTVIKSGQFDPKTFEIGAGQPIGKISFPLNTITKAGQYNLEVGLDKTVTFNDWDFWVYPAELPVVDTKDIYYCTELDSKAEETLQKGGKVFLHAAGKIEKGKEVVMYLSPVFWNTSWFKMRAPHTTGLLIRNDHPALADFPTQSHSNYQWWALVNKTSVMHLEDFPKNFKPIIQPIDTWFMNRKLGLLFEAKVGTGKLLVCSAPVSDTASNAAARQLFYSLKKYMLSPKFNPTDVITVKMVKDLFTVPSKDVWDSFTKGTPDELRPIGNKQ